MARPGWAVLFFAGVLVVPGSIGSTEEGKTPVDEGKPKEPVQLVRLTRMGADVDEKTGLATITVSGSVVSLPPETIIFFELRRGWKDYGLFTVTVDSSKAFRDVKWTSETPLCLANNYYLKTWVPVEAQETSVREFIQKDPKQFPPDEAVAGFPQVWIGREIVVGTPEQIAKQRETIQKTMDRLSLEARRLNNAFQDELDAAKGKRKYYTNDAFDAAAWREWLSGWSEGMRKAQKDFLDLSRRYRGYVEDFPQGDRWGRELLASVAFRSRTELEDFYASVGVQLSDEDHALWDGIDLVARGKSAGYMKGIYDRLRRSFKLEELSKRADSKKGGSASKGKRAK